MMATRFQIAHLSDLPPVPCPCGMTQRAFGQVASGVASLHQVTIQQNSRVHYHRHTTEIYYILSGQGMVELDGERIAVRVGDAVLIQPECRHRAVGELTLLNFVIPAFDPADEWFDESS